MATKGNVAPHCDSRPISLLFLGMDGTDLSQSMNSPSLKGKP